MAKTINGPQFDRDEIFQVFAEKVTASKAIAGVEHVTDFQMDLIVIMFDALLQSNVVVLNETQLANYTKLKEQWNATKSTDLNSTTYEIDYAFNGDGSIVQLEDGSTVKIPNGLKREARQARNDYKKTLEEQGYEF
ncbi:hypothetical protein D3C81_797910 [compost metagenome]